jgi:riboflavin-specific deaminase-like protein
MERVEHSFLPIRRADVSRPFVIGQLGQSLDGRIALPSGESRYINGPAALDHLHRLRAEVDAVVVGIGTVLTDDPQLTVRRVQGKNPVRVIIDPNCRLTPHLRCLHDGEAEVLVIRRSSCRVPLPGGVRRIEVASGNGAGLTCAAIVHALFREGLRKLLVEGGASTVSRFIEEGQLDRLHLLVGPVLLGSGKTGVNLRAVTRLSEALRVKGEIYRFEGGDLLYDCALRDGAVAEAVRGSEEV